MCEQAGINRYVRKAPYVSGCLSGQKGEGPGHTPDSIERERYGHFYQEDMRAASKDNRRNRIHIYDMFNKGGENRGNLLGPEDVTAKKSAPR